MHVLNKKENYLYLLIATFVNLVIVVKLGIQPKTAVAELGIFSMLFIFNLLFFYSIIENLNWGAYLGFLIFVQFLKKWFMQQIHNQLKED